MRERSTGKVVDELRAVAGDRVIVPGAADYDSARALFYGGFDRRPAAIVRVENASEVAQVIRIARDAGVELSVRSGGHSIAGFSVTQSGIVLDLSRMRALEIDQNARTAWAEPGLTAGEYTSAADAFDLATSFGDTGSVGLGGITTGGGIGYLVRKYGLTIDSLLAADVVTAAGELLHVDQEHEPDLFWAIRGGGGNFGVATRFQLQLHPAGAIFGGMLILPATPEVIANFMSEAESAPGELSTIANVMPAPSMPFIPKEVYGRLILLAMLVYAGTPQDGERVLAPFRALAAPLADMLKPMRYAEVYPPEDPAYHPMAVSRNMFIDRVDRAAAELILERLQASTGTFAVAQLRALGGAMSRVPVDATAFAHRRSHVMANLAALYEHPEEAPVHEQWVGAFAKDLRQSDKGSYVGFLGDEGESGVRAAYPAGTYQRLAEIKRRYDPGNLFRLNQNIQPQA